MTKKYAYFEHLPALDQKYLIEAQQGEYTNQWMVGDKEVTVNTEQAHTSFRDTKFMKDLIAKFGAARTHYIRTNPMTCYDWHIDVARDCGILFVLNDVVDTITLYRNEIPGVNYNIAPMRGVSYDLERVTYPLLKPVLLNTKEPHSLINFSNEPRYVLTVGFNNGVTFSDVKDFLDNYATTEY